MRPRGPRQELQHGEPDRDHDPRQHADRDDAEQRDERQAELLRTDAPQRRKALQSNSPSAALISTAESTATGQQRERPGEEESSADSTAAATSPVTWLLPPTESFTAVRESAPLTAKPRRSPRADVGHAERDELLVRIDVVAILDARSRARSPSRCCS